MKFTTITYRLLAILLSTLILTWSVGFSVDIHFCQNQLCNVSFSSENQTDKCHKNTNNKTCCQSSESSSTEIIHNQHSNCCTTNTITSQNVSVSLLETTAEIKKVEHSTWIIIVKNQSIFDFQTIITRKEVLNLNYSSLLLVKNRIILAEQFLC